MKTRNASISLSLIVIVVLFFILKRWQEPEAKEMIDRNPAQLVFTPHAICVMNCRKIDSSEITEIIQKGVINVNRSNRRGWPCPAFALQGRTTTGESLRVILSQCPGETKVITCYNLEEDFPCNCPGDNKKIN